MDNLLKPTDITQVDEAVKKTAADESLNTVTDADVSEARTTAGKTGRDTVDKVTDNVASDTDAANSGATGSKVKDLFKNVTGSVQGMNAAGASMLTRGVTPLGAAANPTDYIMSDVDHLERNAGLAAGAVDSVHATIIKQATRGTTNGDTAIIGTPADNNVYSEETDIVAETVSGKTALYPLEHPRRRSHGTFLQRKPSVVSISGDYLFSGTGETGDDGEYYPSAHSHESDKGVFDRNNLLFNALNPQGGTWRDANGCGAFIAPKRGRYWVRGINPAPSATAYPAAFGSATHPSGNRFDCIGFVDRTDKDGQSVRVPVFQVPVGRNTDMMFDVVDMTPFVESMQQATAETAALLTANKSKFTLGQCEQIAQLFATSQSVIDTPDEVATWPEFANIGRSSLTHVALNSRDDRAFCYNDYETYVEFMHYLEESEIVIGAHRINAHNWKENLKFHKNMEGQNGAAPYWRLKFQGDPGSATSGVAHLGSVPNVKHYAATKASHRAFNTLGKWLYTFRTFWSDLETYCSVIDEGVAKDAILSKIRIQKDACDQIKSNLQLGRSATDSGETSDCFAFAPNTIDMIFGFDPNDLINFDKATGTWYPTCGYYNVYTRNNADNASVVVYDIIPFWMATYMHAYNNTTFRHRLLHNGAAHDSLNGYFSSGKFMPLQIDTFSPNWLTCYFLEAFATFKERIFGPRNQTSGYLRYMKAEDDFGVAGAWNADGTSIASLITDVIADPGCWFTPAMCKPSDLPVCSDASRSSCDESYQQSFGWSMSSTMKVKLGGASDPAFNYNVMFGVQPGKLHMHIRELEGWVKRDVYDGDTIPTPTIEQAFAAPDFTEDTPAGVLCWSTTADHLDRILGYSFPTSGGLESTVFVPLVFKRELSESYSFGVPVLQFDADERPLGFTDNPEDFMYGSDNFHNLPACHGFVLRLHAGYSGATGAAVIGNTAAQAAQVGLCEMLPVFIGTAANAEFDKAKFMLWTFATSIDAPLDFPAECKVQLFKGNKNRIRTSGDTKDSTLVHAQSSEGLADPECNAQDPASITLRQISLYGYRRPVLKDYFTVTYSASNVERAANFGASSFNLAVPATDAKTVTTGASLNPVQFYGWMSRFMNCDQTSKAEAVGLVHRAPRSVLTDWTYYYGTAVWETAFGSGRPIAEQGTGMAISDHSFDDVKTIFSWSNHVPTLSCLSSSVIYDQHGHYADTFAEIDNDGCKTRVASFDGYVPVAAVPAFQDYFEKYFPQSFFSPVADAPFIPGYSDSTDWAALVITGPFHASRNPKTRTTGYINDVRAYVADRPVIRLNRNWNLYGLTADIFAKRFLKGE